MVEKVVLLGILTWLFCGLSFVMCYLLRIQVVYYEWYTFCDTTPRGKQSPRERAYCKAVYEYEDSSWYDHLSKSAWEMMLKANFYRTMMYPQIAAWMWIMPFALFVVFYITGNITIFIFPSLGDWMRRCYIPILSQVNLIPTILRRFHIRPVQTPPPPPPPPPHPPTGVQPGR